MIVQDENVKSQFDRYYPSSKLPVGNFLGFIRF